MGTLMRRSAARGFGFLSLILSLRAAAVLWALARFASFRGTPMGPARSARPITASVGAARDSHISAALAPSRSMIELLRQTNMPAKNHYTEGTTDAAMQRSAILTGQA
jgi:hypothetical protein